MSTLRLSTIQNPSGTTAMTVDEDTGVPNFPLGGVGKILQAVMTAHTTAQNTAGSWQGTGLSRSIVVASASNKVLLLATANGYMNGNNYLNFDVTRHTAAIAAGSATAGTRLSGQTQGFGCIYGNSGDRYQTIPIMYLDTPGSAGTFHYSLIHQHGSGSGIFNHSTPTSTMILLEVSA